ncbi:MAG: signal peptidase I [Candidatus Melainabacteria bacterium]|nr:MAG: signal peptidase I [Candidatus Melainabacteria bacterium]
MFEVFTETAIKSIMLAQGESRRLGYNYVGSEQMLLGLIAEETGIAARVLTSSGVTFVETRAEIDKIIGRGNQQVGDEIPFTPRAKRIIEFAFQESLRLGQNYVGTEHLLFAILKEEQGVAFHALKNLGVDTDRLKEHLLVILENCQVNAVPIQEIASSEKKPFDLTDEATKAIERAKEEACRLGRNYVEREQILLGLIAGSDIAAQVLHECGVEVERARAEVDSHIGRGTAEIGGPVVLAHQGVNLLLKGRFVAESLGDKQIDNVHLLLALVSDKTSVALSVLKSFNLTGQLIEEKLLQKIAIQHSTTLAELQAKLHPPTREVSTAVSAAKRSYAVPDPRYRLPLRRMTPLNPATLPLLCLLCLCIFLRGQLDSSEASIGVPILPVVLGIMIVCAIFVSFLPAVGVSMMPAISDGDVLIGERLTKLLGRPFRRGEIVCFKLNKDLVHLIPNEIKELYSTSTHSPTVEFFRYVFGLTLAKRIVGLPGEQVQVISGLVHINGKPLNQTWASGRQYELKTLGDLGSGHYRPFVNNSSPVIVPAGHFFVMGDNLSPHNLDSHIVGFVSKKSITERIAWHLFRKGQLSFGPVSTAGEADGAGPASSQEEQSQKGADPPAREPAHAGSFFDWVSDEAVRRVVLLLAFLVVPFAFLFMQYHQSQSNFPDLCKQMGNLKQ